jgi:SP family general alpha glucoside:H+ symporter-like MFS transporter
VILHTHATEEQIERGGSYLDCFKGVNLRRTEIVCVVWAAQVWCGQLLNQSYFYEQVGFDSSTSYSLLVGGLGMSCIGTILSWLLIAGLGRRTIYVFGLGWLSLVMFVIGFLSLNKSSKGSQWATAILLIIYEMSYYFTVGPVCYALISEMPSSTLRAKSIALSRIAYYISSIAANVFQPYMLNPTAGNWGGKTGFFWGATGAACCLWAAFRLPEPKGRTYEELDLLFARKIPAHKFKDYHVDAYEQDANGEILVQAKQE